MRINTENMTERSQSDLRTQRVARVSAKGIKRSDSPVSQVKDQEYTSALSRITSRELRRAREQEAAAADTVEPLRQAGGVALDEPFSDAVIDRIFERMLGFAAVG